MILDLMASRNVVPFIPMSLAARDALPWQISSAFSFIAEKTSV